MWLYLIIPVLIAIVFYATSIRNSIKVATPKGGCSSCPNKSNEIGNI